MAADAYSPCPCGSGKKFKWCCQPVHVQIDKAFRQDAEGQHEAALRLMDEVVKEHPDNPEAYGRKAQLLYQNGQVDEAETTLQKAFAINPNYAFGYLLQGHFRQAEGETPGALLLFRKAADYYDPLARDILSQVYSLIAECELKLNRPVAARAAWRTAMHLQPANEELRTAFDKIMGEASHFPAAARREYTFESLPAGADAARRQAWDQALTSAATGKLTDAAAAFEKLTAEDPENRPAWFNLGLTRAWLGDNHGAIEALDHYVGLEPDEARASAAWTLAEVLRCGHGMAAEANYLEHSLLFQIRDPNPIGALLQQWEAAGRLLVLPTGQEQGFLTAIVLERQSDLTPELAATQVPGIGANLMVIGDRLRLWYTDPTALQRMRDELQQRIGPALSSPIANQGPAGFNEVLAEAMVFPVHISNQEEAQRRVTEHVQRFMEETWIHRPLRSLNMIPPIDAAGHGTLRKKLLGAVQFLQDCARPDAVFSYDFDRLRRKLGLLSESVAPGKGGAAADIATMNAAELSGLAVESLSNDDLEKAYQTAIKLDAREIAGRFAHTLVSRPPNTTRPDRYPYYSHLVQLSLAENNTAAALDFVNEGEKADCEQNEGRRRNDYELRRAQIHAKRGDNAEAASIFDRLIERVPSELRYRGSAAEAMLSARQSAHALRFAEGGLAKAREQNNRDSEDYFLELVGAAKKQGA
jgi:tetratricopeptide (TPR) repeat protein